jgi:hypothetical protein
MKDESNYYYYYFQIMYMYYIIYVVTQLHLVHCDLQLFNF